MQVSPSGPSDPQYQGSVAQGTVSATPLALTLGTAITLGLKANLGLLSSEQSSRESRAQRLKALSALLPSVNGQVTETSTQIDLQAIGLGAIKLPPGIPFSFPSVVGPFKYGDARVSATVPILNFSNLRSYRASQENLKASALSLQDARDLVVQAVGNAYLKIIASAARVDSTQAEVNTALALYQRAADQKTAGVAPGIDVLRSEVEWKRQQQLLVAQKNQLEKDKLTLGRVIGLPSGQEFTVADPSPAVPLEAQNLQDALAKAYAHRSDFQAMQAQVRAAEFSVRAAKAERYPILSANGNYGAIGLNLFTNSHGSYSAAGSVEFNIFDGGRIKGDILENDAELTNRKNQLENLRGQIDYEVRNALLDLNSSNEQVSVARINVDLANQTLTQARDRFSAGVADNIEVVQAQQSVADANENLISAVYQNNLSKVALARAVGLAEEGIHAYFANH